MRSLSVTALVLCLVCLVTADPSAEALAREEEFGVSGSVPGYALERGRGGRDQEVMLSTRFFVPASLHDDFISAWRKIAQNTLEEDGIIHYSMKKTDTDNGIFLVFGHWKTWDDYMDHVKQDYFDDFVEFLGDNKIMAHMMPIKAVSKADIHSKKSKAKDSMSVLFKFWVDPRDHRSFIKRWEELADETSKEKGVRTYVLRKSEVDNLVFMVYGTFDSAKDLHNHHYSKHTHRFREWKEDHNVVWKMYPLRAITTGSHKDE